MIFLQAMSKLMDHHVIDDFRRSHDKPETERQTIALRAGAPASLGRCYPHASMNQSQHGTIVFKTSAYMTHGPVSVSYTHLTLPTIYSV